MTPVQPSLLDALEARDNALARVDAAAPSEWKERAYEVAYQVALRQDIFSSEDLWNAGLEKPPEPRAMGPLMLKVVASGLAVFYDMKGCSMKSRHATKVARYRSLLR